MNKHHVVLALSGGMDSGVLLADLVAKANGTHPLKSRPHPGMVIHPFLFQYGSKHNKLERLAAVDLLDYYYPLLLKEQHGSVREVVFVGKPSALTDPDKKVPEGNYNDENMKQTVVPGRNTIFFADMLSYAESLNEPATIMLGVHAGDHHIYPDCRPEWVQTADKLAAVSSEGRVRVVAPFQGFDKAKIVERGLKLNFPFELTRTCYTDDKVACGKCGSCRERLEAFLKNNTPDPLKYQEGCLSCGIMHLKGDGSVPVMSREEDIPKNIKDLPRAHDIVERFARVMKNGAANGVHLPTDIGNDLLQIMGTAAWHTFKYDLLKDTPLS